MTPFNVFEAFASRTHSLRDGRSVQLRSMCPSDESELLQAFERMPADARYMRFMRVVREVDLDRLRQVLDRCPTATRHRRDGPGSRRHGCRRQHRPGAWRGPDALRIRHYRGDAIRR